MINTIITLYEGIIYKSEIIIRRINNMKKIKAMIALSLAITTMCTTVAFAAPSPNSAIIWAIIANEIANSQPAATTESTATAAPAATTSAPAAMPTAEEVKAGGVSIAAAAATPAELNSLATTITTLSNNVGLVPTVKVVKKLVAPAGYVPGTPLTLTWAVAGLKDGATVLAYNLTADGKIEAIKGVVKGGYVTFTVKNIGTVAIVEFADKAPVKDGGLH